MDEGIHKIGEQARKALSSLRAAKAVKKLKISKANDLIEDRNELVKPLLQQVHDAIAAGQAVNGQTSWDGWAKYAGWSKRNLNYILNGRPERTGRNHGSRSVELEEGMVVSFPIYLGGEQEVLTPEKFRVNALPLEMTEYKGKRYARVIFELVETKKKFAPEKKKDRSRHVRSGNPNEALCGVKLNSKNIPKINHEGKRLLANCPKCIELQAHLPSPEPKVKKLSAEETRVAIGTFVSDCKDTENDDHSVEWAQQYRRDFAAAVPEHPEWRKQQVEKESMRIMTMIHARRVTRDEPLSEPAKALAATVDGAHSIPKHMKDRLAERKNLIALGVDPVTRECPGEEDDATLD